MDADEEDDDRPAPARTPKPQRVDPHVEVTAEDDEEKPTEPAPKPPRKPRARKPKAKPAPAQTPIQAAVAAATAGRSRTAANGIVLVALGGLFAGWHFGVVPTAVVAAAFAATVVLGSGIVAVVDLAIRGACGAAVWLHSVATGVLITLLIGTVTAALLTGTYELWAIVATMALVACLVMNLVVGVKHAASQTTVIEERVP